jgi:hypothetical protein
MRSTSLIAVLALFGCATERFAPPGSDPGGDPGRAIVQASGFVFDSLTRTPARGVLVDLGGKLVHTDGAGRFTAELPEGALLLRVTSPDFETLERSVHISMQEITIPLKRLAPLPIGCRLDAGVFRAIVIDLQGRKSLERWARSSMTLRLPVGDRTIGALAWGYRPLDTYHWELTIADAGDEVERVDWHLFDSDLHEYVGSCVPERSGGDPQDTIP